VLEEGMTIVVQPNVVTVDGTAGVQTGELLLVTSTGCERLHAYPRGIGMLRHSDAHGTGAHDAQDRAREKRHGGGPP
jgi:hypothetical protein